MSPGDQGVKPAAPGRATVARGAGAGASATAAGASGAGASATTVVARRNGDLRRDVAASRAVARGASPPAQVLSAPIRGADGPR